MRTDISVDAASLTPANALGGTGERSACSVFPVALRGIPIACYQREPSASAQKLLEARLRICRHPSNTEDAEEAIL